MVIRVTPRNLCTQGTFVLCFFRILSVLLIDSCFPIAGHAFLQTSCRRPLLLVA